MPQVTTPWISICAVLLLLQFTGCASGPTLESEQPSEIPQLSKLSWSELRYICPPEEADEKLEQAIEDFVEIARLRGVDLCVSESVVDVELPGMRLEIDQSPGRFDGGFSVARSQGKVVVRAADDQGLSNALYTILRNVFGARWYWAESLGFELIETELGHVPDGVWTESPSFVQRQLYPIGSEYGRRNRLVGKYSFNHNLARIFNKEAFEKTPEAFATAGGSQREPLESPLSDWQPDMTAEAAIRLSVDAAKKHFDENPLSTSFSLSTNDNSRFDDGPETQAIVSPLEYFRGRPNFTDLVFRYMNRVAEEVFRDPKYLQNAAGEDRYLTSLAYYWMEQSPSFQLHPRVMPVLTSDRAQWHDLAYRKEDKELIRRWSQSGAERIATWDYYFGSPYPYPRQFTQWIAESIPFLYENGVDVFFSQLPAVWGLDGPKGWLASELLWDASGDPEVLLDEFYTHFFGPAQVPIRQFYELAEDRRNQVAGKANWIKFYTDEAGVEVFDLHTLELMRQKIDEAERLSPRESRFAERVRVVSEAFSFTEAYFHYHISKRDLVELSLNAHAAPDQVAADELILARDQWHRSRGTYYEIQSDLWDMPIHKGLRGFDKVLQSDPTLVFVSALVAVGGARSTELNEEEARLYDIAYAWLSRSYEPDSWIDNPDFEYTDKVPRDFMGPDIPAVEPWYLDFRPSEKLSFVGPKLDAGRGIMISGADFVTADQVIGIDPDFVYILEVDVAWRASPDNRVFIRLTWLNEQGGTISESIPLRLYTSAEAQTARLFLPLQAPPLSAGLVIRALTERQYEGDFLELRKIDVRVLAL